MPKLADRSPASASLTRLKAVQARILAPELAGLAGAHGLWLTDDAGSPPTTPMLGRWTRMQWRGGVFAGDIRMRADEPLPFVDDAFRVITLDHVLEQVPTASAWLDEIVRVLAPDGLLVISGFHALSAWSPWLLARGGAHPVLPLRWSQQLARHGVQTYAVRRYGAVLPMLGSDRGGAWMGGAFVLLARKRRLSITPLRPSVRKHVVRVGNLASGVHRECA